MGPCLQISQPRRPLEMLTAWSPGVHTPPWHRRLAVNLLPLLSETALDVYTDQGPGMLLASNDGTVCGAWSSDAPACSTQVLADIYSCGHLCGRTCTLLLSVDTCASSCLPSGTLRFGDEGVYMCAL